MDTDIIHNTRHYKDDITEAKQRSFAKICPSPTFTDPPTRAKVPKVTSSLFGESHGYSLSLVSRTVPPSFVVLRGGPERKQRKREKEGGEEAGSRTALAS